MFRLRKVALYKGVEEKVYDFTDNAYIYGKNSVGKTAFAKVIDFVLGSSEGLSHDGLDNIDSVGAYITNDKTELWLRRSVSGNFEYKRTRESGYSLVSQETYKDIICEAITGNLDSKAIQVYKRVSDEIPSFRSFTFLNFVDETGQGDLGSIFTRGKEERHLVRIRKIMDFFFNYDNAEQIYEESVELEKLEGEYKTISEKKRLYEKGVQDIENLFGILGLNYTGEMFKDYQSFKAYQNDFNREKSKTNGDLAYLVRASHSLAEEIKMYGYLRGQSEATVTRKERTEMLLSMLNTIIIDNPNYSDEVTEIERIIKEIEKDKIILSITDYDESIKRIKNEKRKIDGEIVKLKNQAGALDYEKTIKVLGLLEQAFDIINSNIDLGRVMELETQISEKKKRLRALKYSYSQKDIMDFNRRLTEMYLNSSIENISYLNDDRSERFCVKI